jgi:hypothetical protein
MPLKWELTDQCPKDLPIEGGHRRCTRSEGLLINGSRIDSAMA